MIMTSLKLEGLLTVVVVNMPQAPLPQHHCINRPTGNPPEYCTYCLLHYLLLPAAAAGAAVPLHATLNNGLILCVEGGVIVLSSVTSVLFVKCEKSALSKRVQTQVY